MYLHQPDKAKETLLKTVQRWGVQIIAIGNGTASRETEALVAEVSGDGEKEQGRGCCSDPARPRPCHSTRTRYIMVSEAGASVYSASEARAMSSPTWMRLSAAMSRSPAAARPLAELVKIDPKALGVGLYQHDVDQKRLGGQLEAVVESCVNYVGVDLNTASAALLGYVAGLNSKTAKAVVAHRDANGPFDSRKQLLKVKGLGPRPSSKPPASCACPTRPTRSITPPSTPKATPPRVS